MSDQAILDSCGERSTLARKQDFLAAPVVGGRIVDLGHRAAVRNRRPTAAKSIGDVVDAEAADAAAAMQLARRRAPRLGRDAGRRARRHARARRRPDASSACAELVALVVREGGRTHADAVAEVREAIDFLPLLRGASAPEIREPIALPGSDRRAQHAGAARPRRVRLHQRRGISRSPSSPARSPRRSPPATAVVAKPAEQTPLIAAVAVALLHRGRRSRGRAASPARRRPDRRGAGRRPRIAPASPSPARPKWRA